MMAVFVVIGTLSDHGEKKKQSRKGITLLR